MVAALVALAGCAHAPRAGRASVEGAPLADRDGDGIPDEADACPDAPEDADGWQDADGCPDDDDDGDGIADAADLCPREPEDVDGWQDEDGCPDPDNDQDRIADIDDRCPDEPEVYNGLEDEDGCPDEGEVHVYSCPGPVVYERIAFDAGRDDVPPAAAAVLDAIAATLEANPSIVELALVGHAAAGERAPEALGQRRAEAVRAALLRRGVAPERLRAFSSGARDPLDPTRRALAAQNNRRVALHVLATDEGVVRRWDGTRVVAVER